MIVKEFYETRFDGVNLYRTYSNIEHYIRQVETGNVYIEAIDIESAIFTYEEADEIIEKPKTELERLAEEMGISL